jgi:hypothetical protein
VKGVHTQANLEASFSGPKEAPSGWSASTGMISMIIPHDCNRPGPDGRKVHGIADRTLGSLFAKLAGSKGDNIVRISSPVHGNEY